MASSQAYLLGLLILICSTSIGTGKHMKYKNSTLPVEIRVNDLLKRMTLAEKIGQMTQIERKDASADVMKNYFIG